MLEWFILPDRWGTPCPDVCSLKPSRLDSYWSHGKRLRQNAVLATVLAKALMKFDWLVGWLIDKLIDWLIDQLIDWLIDWLSEDLSIKKFFCLAISPPGSAVTLQNGHHVAGNVSIATERIPK